MWIYTPASFSARESILFGKWLERCDEVYHEEGDLDFMRDGIPILVALAYQHYPKLTPRTASKIVGKLTDFYIQARETAHSEPAGRA